LLTAGLLFVLRAGVGFDPPALELREERAATVVFLVVFFAVAFATIFRDLLTPFLGVLPSDDGLAVAFWTAAALIRADRLGAIASKPSDGTFRIKCPEIINQEEVQNFRLEVERMR
jgi:hypothetical protein